MDSTDERLLEMRVFKAVVEAGGFTAAASLLGGSQPFVSQSVNSLERRLGVQLLHRSTRRQRLTKEGEHFLSSCNDILDSLEEAEAQVRSSEPTGNLCISVPQAFGMDQLVPAMPGFLSSYPKLCVHFSLSDSPRQPDRGQLRCRSPHGPPAGFLFAQPKALRPATNRRRFSGLSRCARHTRDAARPA
jgi:DNA-binding transcriptional LysR family regulator